MKRIGLFLLTNLAVLIVIGIVFSVLSAFGINFGSGLDASGVGLDLGSLLAFSAVIGMAGSFVSLAMSKWVAKRQTGAQVIEQPRNEIESWLVQTVQHQARSAGIGVPEVAIWDDPSPNAFATGARRDSALVAVSTGLLRSMSREEVEAVVGHEISHVANGDMITMTLVQGVVNTFVFFFSRVVGHFVDRVVFKTERGHGPAFWITSIVAQIVFGVLASIIVCWFSRQREFRADAGAAKLRGAGSMIKALEALKRGSTEPLPDQMAALGISGGGGSSFAVLFSTHPPLDERIARLRS